MAEVKKYSPLTDSATQPNNQQGVTLPIPQAQPKLPLETIFLPLVQRPIFPGMLVPINISDRNVIEALQGGKKNHAEFISLSLVRTREKREEPFPKIPNLDDIYQTGCLARVLRIAMAPEGEAQVMIHALSKTRIVRLFAHREKKYLLARLHYPSSLQLEKETELSENQQKAYMSSLVAKIKELISLNAMFAEEMKLVMGNHLNSSPQQVIYLLAGLISYPSPDELQKLFETTKLSELFDFMLHFLQKEIEISKVREKINKKIEGQVSKQQRDFFLREQLKMIKQELGIEKDESTSLVKKFRDRMEKLTLGDRAKKVCEEEIEKLESLDTRSAEYNVVRNYLEWIVDLPWGIFEKSEIDLDKAKKILDRDHYGMEKVKEKILTLIAIEKLKKAPTGSIITLLGPPGVGKTSLGKSISAALGKKFYRFSLGGMRDEAEIRGHRRTYVGAMPGKFIQAMKSVGSQNPIIMLDEIDKVSSSFQGDPSSALLEVLDKEQNHSFMDLYLDLPFDFSKTLFITTANQLDTIPKPLLDRMEVIELSGYLAEEKVKIARRYLMPKLMKQNGLPKNFVQISTSALTHIIDGYARESGVRSLEKHLQTIYGKAALQLVSAKQKIKKIVIGQKDVKKYLEKPIFSDEPTDYKNTAGIVTGLAWTANGGDSFLIEAIFIETPHQPQTSQSPQTPKLNYPKRLDLKVTGSLGKVMEESAQIALSYAKTYLYQFEQKDYVQAQKQLETRAVHLHVPSGATPKDGPSAGSTMALALVSLALNKPVKPSLAMTGEITLSGRILAIGGLREKLIAAKRAKKKKIIVPKQNLKDVENLPPHITKGLDINFASTFDDIVKIALKK